MDYIHTRPLNKANTFTRLSVTVLFFVISILYHLFVVSATINPLTILKSYFDLYASAIER